MTATAYPLSWPQNMPRSRSRETGKFKTSLRALGVITYPDNGMVAVQPWVWL